MHRVVMATPRGRDSSAVVMGEIRVRVVAVVPTGVDVHGYARQLGHGV